MSLSSSEIDALEQSVALGDIEPVITTLITKLEQASNEWEELAQTLRVIQADYFLIKSQVTRGTISTENARLAYNQINANVIGIIGRIKAGKKTLADPVTPPRQAWRYYVAGGVVALALAFAGWKFFAPVKDDCPEYGDAITEKVMLLPFKKSSADKESTPEIDISDDLNQLIRKDIQLNGHAESDVYEKYDIEKNYPNPSEAAKTAEHCGVQMIVWGKMRKGKDSVEVYYKLLNPTVKTAQNNDERLNKLLELVDEGVWVDDVKTISKLLYLVLANQKGDTQMALSVFQDITKNSTPTAAAARTDTTKLSPNEVSKLLTLADYMRTHNMKDEALRYYDQILAAYPDNEQALQRRGAMNYEGGKYWAAARDLQGVEADPAKTDPKILQVRVDAYLKCGWPDKARQDLEQYKKLEAGVQDKVFIKDRERAISDSLKVYNLRLEATKLAAEKKPNDDKAQLDLAKAHTAVGHPDKAIQIAENVQRRKPGSVEAMKTVVEAAAQKGDIQKVNETVEKAERAGYNTKGFKFVSPTVRPLATPVKKDN